MGMQKMMAAAIGLMAALIALPAAGRAEDKPTILGRVEIAFSGFKNVHGTVVTPVEVVVERKLPKGADVQGKLLSCRVKTDAEGFFSTSDLPLEPGDQVSVTSILLQETEIRTSKGAMVATMTLPGTLFPWIYWHPKDGDGNLLGQLFGGDGSYAFRSTSPQQNGLFILGHARYDLDDSAKVGGWFEGCGIRFEVTAGEDGTRRLSFSNGSTVSLLRDIALLDHHINRQRGEAREAARRERDNLVELAAAQARQGAGSTRVQTSIRGK